MKAVHSSKNLALVTLALAALAGFAVDVQADDVVFTAPSRAVRYEDLNLSTAAGVTALYQRIHTAALQVCGDVDSRQPDQATAAQACVEQAIASSVRAVNRESLTRIASVHGYDGATSVSVASIR